MAKQKIMKIVTMIKNNPVSGVEYGETKIALSQEENVRQPHIARYFRQPHIARYLRIKARNRHLLNKNRTTQK